MKLIGTQCDCCGVKLDSQLLANLSWENQPSVFALEFPRDGINGGYWKMDVCGECRRTLYDAIDGTIKGLREKGKV